LLHANDEHGAKSLQFDILSSETELASEMKIQHQYEVWCEENLVVNPSLYGNVILFEFD
jgi:hypothetical protein